jgi:hypothetical protein
MFQKFGKEIPQSLVDAVSGIMYEAKADEPAAPDADAIARRKRLQAIKDKQEDDAAERGAGEKKSSGVRQVAGKAYGGAKQKDDDLEESKKHMDEADVEESGLRMAAHAAHKAGQKNFEFQGKTYPVKVTKEDKSCVTKPEVKKIADKEVGKHEKKMHHEEKQLDEKAVSIAQQKFMGMVNAVKKGKMKAPSKEVGKAAHSMTKKAAHDFAATKHKGLPQHKEEVEQVVEYKGQPKDVPFDADKPHGKIATAGKKGYGVSAAKHLARQGLRKFLKKETLMGKAGCTSEEADLEESRGHKILATKLKQLSMQSHGMAPELSVSPQDIKDKLKDAASINQVEIVKQKDSSIKKEAAGNPGPVRKHVPSPMEKPSKDDMAAWHAKQKEKHAYKKEEALSEEFHPNVHAELKKHAGKIGAVMHNTKDNAIAVIVHHTDDKGLSGPHHVHFFHNDKKVHSTVHPTFGDAESHAVDTITSKKGLKHLGKMHTLMEEQIDEGSSTEFQDKLRSSVPKGKGLKNTEFQNIVARKNKKDPHCPGCGLHASDEAKGGKHGKFCKQANEEVEQIDELSKDTLTSYKNKATSDKEGHDDVKYDGDQSFTNRMKANWKGSLRKKGIANANKKLGEENQIDETATLDQYIKSMGYDPEHMEKNKKVMFSKTNAFKTWASTRQEGLYDAGQKGTQDIDTHMSPGATARG